jgi:tetratricopeptide (TPR) repeat protein
MADATDMKAGGDGLMEDQVRYSLEEAHEQFARQFNGRVWALLEKEERSPEEDEEMLLAQSASLYHWRHVGTVVHEQRGQWMFSHLYTVLEDPDRALRHASRCIEITQANRSQMADFDIAYAHEAMARALALNGRADKAKEHFEQAAKAGEAISDPEDREIFLGDFGAGRWYGIG